MRAQPRTPLRRSRGWPRTCPTRCCNPLSWNLAEPGTPGGGVFARATERSRPNRPPAHRFSAIRGLPVLKPLTDRYLASRDRETRCSRGSPQRAGRRPRPAPRCRGSGHGDRHHNRNPRRPGPRTHRPEPGETGADERRSQRHPRPCRRRARLEIRFVRGSRKACISVADTGPGVPGIRSLPESSNRSSPRRPKARGLGLPLALHIVREHGGEMQVASGRERGAVFTMAFPGRVDRRRCATVPAASHVVLNTNRGRAVSRILDA